MDKYINIFLNDMLYVPQIHYENTIPENELCNYILSCILSSKYRKTKADQHTITSLKEKIKNTVNSKDPLEFTIPFGAYKGW